ncbi:hypothetical protein ACFL2V_21295, partial [Pseudomonadota bacterium]
NHWEFLVRRFGRHADSVIPGPIRLISRNRSLANQFAAVFSAGSKFYLLVMLEPEQLSKLSDIEKQVRQLVAFGDEWALVLQNLEQIVQIRRDDGSQPGPSDIEVLVVLSRVATSWLPLERPKSDACILSLPDFISIFDSLKDLDEFDRFLAYVDGHKSTTGPMTGIADQFASFRDSHAVLIEGAIEPTMISLDPHWGSNWRFNDLREFWRSAPSQFPDGELTWNIESKSDGLQCLIAKGFPVLAWSTVVGGCTVQVVFEMQLQELDLNDGRVLELFINCLTDSFSQRSNLLEKVDIFNNHHIVIHCEANQAALASKADDPTTEENTALPLLSGWALCDNHAFPGLVVSVDVNLARVQSRLDSPRDASFEVECLIEVVVGLAKLLGTRISENVVAMLEGTAEKLPRFTLQRVQRSVDVPDFPRPKVPLPEQYKIARRELAIVLKQQGAEASKRYELAQAKKVIDSARDTFRQKVHEQISELDRNSLLLFCIEQNDALTAEYREEASRIKQSFNHEVSYDRSEAMAEAHERFTLGARNYRYLLECCLSLPAHGKATAHSSAVIQLVASIDWLFVLYGASDTLHNDIDVAGLELDHSFVPEVFYSQDRDEKERLFSIEMAQAKLGIDLLQEDEVNSAQGNGDEWDVVDRVFESDLGFPFTHLMQVLQVLTRWYEVGGESELRFCYQASPGVIVEKITESIEGLSEAKVHSMLNFLTLDSTTVRRLLGKEIDELDVPVWEHTKRGNRYTIRPLIKIEDDLIAWGAAAADRALSIWVGSISEGYLPADFNWPNVRDQVRIIKKGIEKQLEVQAFEVCSRATKYVVSGIDFKRKYPKEQFDDVGDYDVLMYWPGSNRWLSVECKYNQPPFCLKDTRRLRDRIFGRGKDKGQLGKLEKRRLFLCEHRDKLRELLGWPAPQSGSESVFSEVYVSRHIYWWMRYPPYNVPTSFVRIDALAKWLDLLC